MPKKILSGIYDDNAVHLYINSMWSTSALRGPLIYSSPSIMWFGLEADSLIQCPQVF